MGKRSHGKGIRPGGRVTGPLGALLIGLLAAAAAVAVPGDLDLRFGTDGKRIIDRGAPEQALDMAIRPDGRILLSGYSAGNIQLQSLLTDGSIDPAMGMGGSATIDLGGFDTGDAVALQPDGRIVVAGSTSAGAGGSDDFVVLRRAANGTPDPTFTQRVIDHGAGSDIAYDIALRPDGRMVAVGSGGATPDIVVRGLLAGGGDDPLLDGDGLRSIHLGGDETARAVALQPDGAIVVVGDRLLGGEYDPFVLRLGADGSDDVSFGGGSGRRIFAEPGLESFRDVAVQPDGRIVLVGTAAGDVVVRRLLPGGADDPGFNGGSRLLIDLGPNEQGEAVALQGDGKIVVAGQTRSSGPVPDMLVARIQPGGTLDATFHFDGVRTIDFGKDDAAAAVAIDDRGRTVVAGVALGVTDNDLAVARLEADPAPAGGPGSGGAGPGGTPPPTSLRAPRCGGRSATIVGTAGADRLRGTSRADVIVALGGRDTVLGLGGNDILCGGAGRDLISGGRGADRLLGGPGRDVLRGGAGRDLLIGGPGGDRCAGGAARDRAVCERRSGL